MKKKSAAWLLLAVLVIWTLAAGQAAPSDYDMSAPENLRPDHLYAQSALLIDMDSGVELFAKDANIRMYPASTTKIMTLMLALESDIGLDDTVTIPAEAADIPKGSSVIPVQPGDTMRFRDLLCGFMLSSGNDGANAIAVLVDGSIPAFVERMNARAAELGCTGTHFVNAHGYHDANHYTTARDLAIMSRTAMENADFREIVAQPAWDMTVTRDGKTGTGTIVSRNTLLIKDEKYYYADCTGIKTGHHNAAGWCFVGSAERDGMRLICVDLNCEKEMEKWYDAARLFEYGFTRYEEAPAFRLLEAAAGSLTRVRVENAAADDPEGGVLSLFMTPIEGGEATLRIVRDNDESAQRASEALIQSAQIEWTRQIIAPISEGEVLGTLRCALPDGKSVVAQLSASRDVSEAEAAEPEPKAESEEAPVQETVQRRVPVLPILLTIAMIAVAATALAIIHGKRRRRKRRRRKGNPSRRSR